MYGNRYTENLRLLVRGFFIVDGVTTAWWLCEQLFRFRFDRDNWWVTEYKNEKYSVKL